LILFRSCRLYFQLLWRGKERLYR